MRSNVGAVWEIHQPFWSEMKCQSRKCHIYCWIKGFNSSGCWQDSQCLHKDTAKRVPPLTHMTSKCLLKGKIQNWASSTLRGTILASLLPPTSTPVAETDWKCGAAPPRTPSSCVPFIHRHRGAGVVTCYCCYLCEASTDNQDGAEICSFSCVKRSRPLLWHKLANTSTTCLTESAGLQQCIQAVSGWSNPQWITGNWPQASLLPACNSQVGTHICTAVDTIMFSLIV